jgi:hypothetical protein
MNSEITFRKYESEDENFIMSSLLRSYRDSVVNKDIPTKIYYDNQRSVTSKLLESADILVACSPDMSDQIYGYVVYEQPSLLHYIYVKYTFRKFGIAKELLSRAELTTPTIITHSPRSKTADFIYNPYLLWKL